MTATGHALVGALLAAKFPDPIVALPLAFVSHFVFDIMPHWDIGTHIKKKSPKVARNQAIVDVLISGVTSLILYLYVTPEPNIVYLYTVVFFAQLPDWLFTPYVFLKSRHPIAIWLFKVQHKLHGPGLDLPWGVITQILAVIFMYILLFVIL